MKDHHNPIRRRRTAVGLAHGRATHPQYLPEGYKMQDYAFELTTNGFTLPAFALWNSGLGFYCGYVGIDETNGCYQSDHQMEMCEYEQAEKVHGGITFNGHFEFLEQGLKFVDFSNCEAESWSDSTFLIKKHKFEPNSMREKSNGGRTSRNCRHEPVTSINEMDLSNSRSEAETTTGIDWIGFDCGHGPDKCFLNPNGKERDIDFVLDNLKLIVKIVAGSSYEISKRGKVGLPVTEEEHNKMMVLAVTGDSCAEKYIQNLKVSN